ncbi:MAG TPA: SRPBCC domain-containing protein, partial [Rhizomicrobium sp.]
MNVPIIETPIRLTLTRSFDVSPERLFDAWLSPGFGEWLGMEGMVCLSCEIDPRVGGQWKMLHRTPDGQTLDHSGIYKEIDRPSRLAFTWSGGCSGPNVTLV